MNRIKTVGLMVALTLILLFNTAGRENGDDIRLDYVIGDELRHLLVQRQDHSPDEERVARLEAMRKGH